MLEKHSDWSLFLDYLQSPATSAVIGRLMNIPVSVVEAYRKQLAGAEFVQSKGLHREGLQAYAVAARSRMLCSRWVMTPALERARREYDEGKIEMFQAAIVVDNDVCWVIYAIPRKRRDTSRQPWFSSTEVLA